MYFESIRKWEDIIGVHTEAYAAKLYQDGSNISDTLSTLYENNFELYDIKTFADAPIVEIDGNNIHSKSLLNARPKTGYKSRPMVYDLLLLNDKENSLSRNNKSFIRKVIFVFCVYKYFDQALFIAIKSFKNDTLNESEKNEIVQGIKNLHSDSLSIIRRIMENIKSPSFVLKKR
tara:strand:+ start:189 stop:713 length:525 start_codon:yes stop_codon:yes gene_type:complete